MKWFSWKIPCRDHPGGVLLGPFNGRGANFILHGVGKPIPQSGDSTTHIDGANDEDESVSISVQMPDLIFQKQITTVSCIPPLCRFNFSRTLKASLDKVILQPTDLSSWLQLLLLPTCILRFYVPKSTVEERSGNQKILQTGSINQALAKWKEPNGCMELLQNVLEVHKELKRSRKRSKKKLHPNTQACKKKLNYGHYTSAIRIPSSNGVAPPNADTLHELQLKHPYAPPPILPLEDITAVPVSVDAKAVLAAIRRFPMGISCGRDGLRAQHFLDALSGSAAAVSEELLSLIAGVVNLWLSGNCPPILGEYIASAPLTPLLKPDGGYYLEKTVLKVSCWVCLWRNGSISGIPPVWHGYSFQR